MARLTLVDGENITRPTYEVMKKRVELSFQVIQALQAEVESYRELSKIKDDRLKTLETLLRKMHKKM